MSSRRKTNETYQLSAKQDRPFPVMFFLRKDVKRNMRNKTIKPAIGRANSASLYTVTEACRCVRGGSDLIIICKAH